MRRVLAVLIAVLTAVWPLLLPQPISANPCGVTTAENGSIYAKAGHYFNQSGEMEIEQKNKAYGATGAVGEGGTAVTQNSQYAKGGYANANQTGQNTQDTHNKAKNYSSADGGPAGNTGGNTSVGGDADAKVLGIQVPIAKGNEANGGSGGSSIGGISDASGDGGAGGAGIGGVSDASGNGGAGGSSGAGGNGGIAGLASADGGAGGAGAPGGNNLGLAGSATGTGAAGGNNLGLAGDASAASGGSGGAGGSADGGNALALQKGTAWGGDASGGRIYTGSADGGAGGDVWNKASQNNEQEVNNDDNTAIAKGGKNHLTSSNTANGGTGGAGGSATNGSQTAGSLSRSVSDIAPVTTTVSVGGASGDPCKQIIKNSTGVLAVNGVNDIKNSAMQNSTTQLGNAANTSVNLGDLGNLKSKSYYGDTDLKGGAPNININPNNNQNTNIISF